MNSFKINDKLKEFSLLLSDGEIIQPNYGDLVETAKPFAPYDQGRVIFKCLSCNSKIDIDLLNNLNKALLTIYYINNQEIIEYLGSNSNLFSVLNDDGTFFGYVNYFRKFSLPAELLFEKCAKCNQYYCMIYNIIGEPGRVVDATVVYGIFRIDTDDNTLYKITHK